MPSDVVPSENAREKYKKEEEKEKGDKKVMQRKKKQRREIRKSFAIFASYKDTSFTELITSFNLNYLLKDPKLVIFLLLCQSSLGN